MRSALSVIAVLATLAAGLMGLSGSTRLTPTPHPPGSPPRSAADPPTPASSPTAPPQVIPVVASRSVAPLRHVVPPDFLVVASGTIDRRRLSGIRALPGVRDLVTMDGGAVRLASKRVNVLGVDPSQFRGWTPLDTAATDQVWDALARQQVVLAPPIRERLRLGVGDSAPLAARVTRGVQVGGVAPLGLPGIDALVSRDLARQLGLVPDIAVLVNAPGVDRTALATRLRQAVGSATQVIRLSQDPLPVDSGVVPSGRPRTYLELYKQAAAHCPGLSWTILAAIGQIESDHGRNNGPSSAGALGPMQFLPGTWRLYGIDGDGDGQANIMDPFDAVPSAARYLCANGAGQGGEALANAIWHYNHADWYVRAVLDLAQAYARAYP